MASKLNTWNCFIFSISFVSAERDYAADKSILGQLEAMVTLRSL